MVKLFIIKLQNEKYLKKIDLISHRFEFNIENCCSNEMVHESFSLNCAVVLLNQTLMFLSYPFVDVATNLVTPALSRLECLKTQPIIPLLWVEEKSGRL